MTGNDPQLLWRQFSFDDVQIGAAHAARSHAQQNVSRPQARIGNIADLKRTLCDGSRRSKDGGFHGGRAIGFYHARVEASVPPLTGCIPSSEDDPPTWVPVARRKEELERGKREWHGAFNRFHEAKLRSNSSPSHVAVNLMPSGYDLAAI